MCSVHYTVSTGLYEFMRMVKDKLGCLHLYAILISTQREELQNQHCVKEKQNTSVIYILKALIA